jgi:uncharacterized protein (TIGR02246 family)
MPVKRAADMMQAWGDRFRARDLDGLMELFEPDAIWISDKGEVISGHEGIRGVFSDFMALDPEFVSEESQVFEAGDIALVQSGWSVRGTSPEGEPTEVSGRTADILRRGPDQQWRYVIDSPFGGG